MKFRYSFYLTAIDLIKARHLTQSVSYSIHHDVEENTSGEWGARELGLVKPH